MYFERHAPGKTEEEQREAAKSEWYEVVVVSTQEIVGEPVCGARLAMAVADELTKSTGIKHVERIIRFANCT